MEILHNSTVTDMDGLSPEELYEYYLANPWKYYQNYVAGSISPYYDAKLACIGAAEELCEFLTASNKEETISEAGDFLFQLTSVANFHKVDLSHIDVVELDSETMSSLPLESFNHIEEAFGEVLGAIMKMARYPNYEEVFQKKWGMTAPERIQVKMKEVIEHLKWYFWNAFGLTLKDIMDYNLHKLDERHSGDGNYFFSSGFRNTLSNGSTTNR